MTDKKESPLDRATETYYRLWLRDVMNDTRALLDLVAIARKEYQRSEVDVDFETALKWVLNSVERTIRVIAKEMGVKGETSDVASRQRRVKDE